MNKENNEIKRLYRSNEEKVIAGVCGGIAEYFNIDPIWPRLIGILLIFFNGVGIIAYIVLWILMPENPYQKKDEDDKIETNEKDKKNKKIKEKEKTIAEKNNNSFTKKLKKEFNEEIESKAKKHNIGKDEVVDKYLFKNHKNNENKINSYTIIGGILILIGILFLLKEFFWNFVDKIFWPVIIISIGLVLLLRR